MVFFQPNLDVLCYLPFLFNIQSFISLLATSYIVYAGMTNMLEHAGQHGLDAVHRPELPCMAMICFFFLKDRWKGYLGSKFFDTEFFLR